MDVQSPVRRQSKRILFSVFTFCALAHLGVGSYFFVTGLAKGSGGSVLIGLACFSGLALFATPLWLVSVLEWHTKLLDRQNRILLTIARELSRDEIANDQPSAELASVR